MKIIKVLTTCLTVCGLSLVTPNYVSANDTVIEHSSVFVQIEEDDDDKNIIITPQAVTTPLTPAGNLTLVDDVYTEDESSKQFITVVSKNGNYFYLIIDRDNDTENVYFLNLVDEYDLLQLLGEEFVMPEPDIVEVLVEVPVEREPEVVTAEPIVEEKSSSMLPMLLLLGLAGAGGGYYYLNYVKGKDDNSQNIDFDDNDDDFDDNDDSWDDDNNDE